MLSVCAAASLSTTRYCLVSQSARTHFCCVSLVVRWTAAVTAMPASQFCSCLLQDVWSCRRHQLAER